METLLYIGKVSLYWTLLYGCYWLMLRKHTFFQWNRAYLIASLLAAFLLPEVIYPASGPQLPVIYEVNAATFTVSAAPRQPAGGFTWWQGIAIVYAFGLVTFGSQLIREIARLVRYLKSGEVIDLEDCTIVLIDSNQVGSFSFLKWIVINRNDYENHFDAILRHEMVHTHQRHSLDILLVEVLRTLFWFHPVLPLYKRSLQEIHEYLADAEAPNREHYAKFLVAYALNAPVAALTNHFFKPSQIKNRIKMIYKSRTSKWMLGTYAVAAALIGSVAVFVAGCESQVSKETEPPKVEQKEAVVVPDEAVKDEKVYTVVDKQPLFPGGVKEMYKFLGQNIRYPKKAIDANVQGRVFLAFVVTETGEISDLRILKGLGAGCDEEALRVVSTMPKWVPGEVDGKPVRVKYNLPINFQLEETPSTDTTQATVPGVAKSPTKVTLRLNDQLTLPGSQPLYILNGEEMEEGLSLNTIDPNTIESLNVFKGAEATKIYGSKGANGVISIITKDSNNK